MLAARGRQRPGLDRDRHGRQAGQALGRELSALLAGDAARYPVGASLRVQTAGTREADAWLFTVEAQETLTLPGGTVPALRLSRRPGHAHEPLLELWLGPGPDYAPVRLRLTQPGGDWLDLQWSGTDRG